MGLNLMTNPMAYHLMLKHRRFFRQLRHELKFSRTGLVAARVQIVTEEPPILLIDTIGLSRLPLQRWWRQYLATGQLPG